MAILVSPGVVQFKFESYYESEKHSPTCVCLELENATLPILQTALNHLENWYVRALLDETL